MAILRNGLLGGITGKLGNTVCYMVNGKQVVRMIVKSSKPPTEKQLNNRAQMSLVNDFLKPIKALINIGYAVEAKKRLASAYCLAVGYHKKHALKGEPSNSEINYSKVMVSSGEHPDLDDVYAVLDGNVLQISWLSEDNYRAHRCDQVMMLAYYPPVETDHSYRARFKLCGVDRFQGQDTMELPAELTGRPIEVYVFVVAVNGKAVSNSQYLGRLGEMS